MMTAPFDRYSLTHAAAGAIFELSRIPAGLAIGSHVAFEAVEDSVKRRLKRVWPDSSPESLSNHLGDLASFTSGYYAARRLSRSKDGQVVVTALVAVGAGVWAWSLMRRGDLWRAPSEA